MFPSLIVTNKAVKKIETGYPWLFKDDVVGRKPNIAGIVNLLDKKRHFAGHAFCSPESRYFLRIFSRLKEDINKDFWRKKIRRAYERRRLIETITNAFRVVYAESDGLPSIIIDKYNDIWAFQITSAGAETIKNELLEIIAEDYKPASIIEKNAAKVVFGEKTATTVKEGDQRFEVDVLNGQKTGAYLDYRGFRLKARELAFGKCLDAFCYQGWFACQIAPTAKYVTAIDSSADAIEAARKNAAQNNHKNINFIKSDVFEYLKTCSEKFDFIHFDPPSFVKSYSNLAPALRGYHKLMAEGLRLINPGGIIFLSSCSHNISENLLEKTTIDSIKKSGHHHEIIFRGIQDKDHPLLKGFPEALYLKTVGIKILGLIRKIFLGI